MCQFFSHQGPCIIPGEKINSNIWKHAISPCSRNIWSNVSTQFKKIYNKGRVDILMWHCCMWCCFYPNYNNSQTLAKPKPRLQTEKNLPQPEPKFFLCRNLTTDRTYSLHSNSLLKYGAGKSTFWVWNHKTKQIITKQIVSMHINSIS